MKMTARPDGSLVIELGSHEKETLRYVAERASFMDTPPEQQEKILRLAEEILAGLGYRSE